MIVALPGLFSYLFLRIFKIVPWDIIELFDDTDVVMEAWLDLFLQIVDKHIQIKEKHGVKHKSASVDITRNSRCNEMYRCISLLEMMMIISFGGIKLSK